MSTMTCRELVELLIDYISHELPPEHRQRIDEHLNRCPPCIYYVETYHLTIKLTRQLPAAPLPPQLAERLRKALEEIKREQGQVG